MPMLILTLISFAAYLFIAQRQNHAFVYFLLSIVLTPITCLLFHPILGDNSPGYLVSFGLTVMTVGLIGKSNTYTSVREHGAFFVYLILLNLFMTITLQLNSFYNIGERVRDVALFAEIYKNFHRAQEPWLAGTSLSYYSYSYKIGAVLGKLSFQRFWTGYHLAIGNALACIISLLFYYFYRLRLHNFIFAFLSALTIGCATNLKSIQSLFSAQGSFISQTRLASSEYLITEFPGFSFLLGDAHPHFLNLFVVILALIFLKLSIRKKEISKLSLFLILVCLTYASNSWDLISLAISFLVICLLHRNWRFWRDLALENKKNSLIGIACILAVALYVFAFEGRPNAMIELKFNLLTSLKIEFGVIFRQFFWHILLTLPWIISLGKRSLLAFSITSTIATLTGLGFIFVLGYFVAYGIGRYHFNLTQCHRRDFPSQFNAFFVIGLILLLLPDLFYVDDAYGGQYERMNTVFKIYYSAWIIWGIGVIDAIHALSFKKIKTGALALMSVALIFALVFYTKSFRKRYFPDSLRGTLRLDKKYNGFAKAVRFLDQYRNSLVLVEASNTAYSNDNTLSSISGHRSYLGWKNHVDLLTRRYSMTETRQNQIDQVYRDPDCRRKLRVLKSMNVDFLIMGPMERKRFGRLDLAHFHCLSQSFQSGEYRIYSF
jgi:uncharacterized membrane protein